jgi:hypothetical protein
MSKQSKRKIYKRIEEKRRDIKGSRFMVQGSRT